MAKLFLKNMVNHQSKLKKWSQNLRRNHVQNILMKGSLQVKLPTICRDESKEQKTRREKETESKEKR